MAFGTTKTGHLLIFALTTTPALPSVSETLLKTRSYNMGLKWSKTFTNTSYLENGSY